MNDEKRNYFGPAEVLAQALQLRLARKLAAAVEPEVLVGVEHEFLYVRVRRPGESIPAMEVYNCE